MADLTISYLGLNLKSPLVIDVTGYNDEFDQLSELEKSGAGAILLKPLFEEQITDSDIDTENNSLSNPDNRENPKNSYLQYIEQFKKTLTIPVIANIDCMTIGKWLPFTRKIEDAGADALELNVFFMPSDKDFLGWDYEREYIDLVSKITSTLKIPVSVKLNCQFSNMLNITNQLFYRGVRAISLYNQSFIYDIDVENLEYLPAPAINQNQELYSIIRWTSLISAQFN